MSFHVIIIIIYCLCSNIFAHLEHLLCVLLQEICTKATRTNVEDSERHTERGHSSRTGRATSVAWTWFRYDTDQKTVLCKSCRKSSKYNKKSAFACGYFIEYLDIWPQPASSSKCFELKTTLCCNFTSSK